MTQRSRLHIAVFLAPAVLVYTAVMIWPLFNTLRLSLYTGGEAGPAFAGLENFRTLFGDPRWSGAFWNALGNNFWFFFIHMLVQNPIGVALAAILSHPRLRFAALYRSAIFIPTILSFVIVGFAWKLILSPIWGIAPSMLDAVGLKALFAPWLGKEEYALTTLALISVWQFVGIPMMLIYAALLSIPEEVLEAGEIDGLTGWAAFWKIKLHRVGRTQPLHHADNDREEREIGRDDRLRDQPLKPQRIHHHDDHRRDGKDRNGLAGNGPGHHAHVHRPVVNDAHGQRHAQHRADGKAEKRRRQRHPAMIDKAPLR